jgi:hypothetical protein
MLLSGTSSASPFSWLCIPAIQMLFIATCCFLLAGLAFLFATLSSLSCRPCCAVTLIAALALFGG